MTLIYGIMCLVLIDLIAPDHLHSSEQISCILSDLNLYSKDIILSQNCHNFLSAHLTYKIQQNFDMQCKTSLLHEICVYRLNKNTTGNFFMYSGWTVIFTAILWTPALYCSWWQTGIVSKATLSEVIWVKVDGSCL